MVLQLRLVWLRAEEQEVMQHRPIGSGKTLTSTPNCEPLMCWCAARYHLITYLFTYLKVGGVAQCLERRSMSR